MSPGKPDSSAMPNHFAPYTKFLTPKLERTPTLFEVSAARW